MVIVAKAQTNTEILTNEKIIKLSKIGLQPSVIISKIRSSKTNFDVSTDALVNLSDNNVANEVIDEMIKKNAQGSGSGQGNTKPAKGGTNSSNPNVMHKQGIYYYDANTPTLQRVDPSVVSSSNQGGFGEKVAQHYTYGISKSTSRSSLSGAHSMMKITETSPDFYFYFKEDANANADSWFFANATSPKEFVLVNLKTKKESRDMETGSGNFYGSSSGIPEKDKIQFKYTEVSEGIYKVTFSQPLKEGGEYCFIYASAAPERWSHGGNKVFDFGISQGN